MRYFFTHTIALCCLLLASTSFANKNLPSAFLTQEDKEHLNQAALDAYINFFNTNVKSVQDIEKYFFHAKNPHLQKDFQKFFSSKDRAPRLSRVNNTLKIKYQDAEVNILWPDMDKTRIIIEGISWTLDPSAPLIEQFDTLRSKILRNVNTSSNTSSLFSIVPQANANVILTGVKALGKICRSREGCAALIGGISGAMATNIGSKALNGVIDLGLELSCIAIDAAGFKPWKKSFVCRQWNLNNIENEKKTQEGAKPEKDPDSQWVATNPKCPPKDATNNEVFDASMAEVRKDSNGKWPSYVKWDRVLAKTKDGNILEAYIFDSSQDASLEKGKEAKQQLVYSKGDNTSSLETVNFQQADKTYVPIKVTDTLNDDASIPYRAPMKKMKALAEAISDWNKTCRTLAKATKAQPETAAEATKVIQEEAKKETAK